MTYKNITATLDVLILGKVEDALKEVGVPGLTISEVEGYGVYKNFYQRDWLTTHARIQIFVPESRVDEIVNVIMEVAGAGSEEAGIITVSPVERMFRIYDREEIREEDC